MSLQISFSVEKERFLALNAFNIEIICTNAFCDAIIQKQGLKPSDEPR